jgi:hypothetical protein
LVHAKDADTLLEIANRLPTPDDLSTYEETVAAGFRTVASAIKRGYVINRQFFQTRADGTRKYEGFTRVQGGFLTVHAAENWVEEHPELWDDDDLVIEKA